MGVPFSPPVVVDVSVIIAGLMADGRARKVILHTEAPLYVPEYIHQEVHARIDTLAERAGRPAEVIEAVLNDLEAQFEIAPETLIRAYFEEATRLAAQAKAHGDEAYIALALGLEAPVWTYDADFDRIEEIETISTTDVECWPAAEPE